MNYFLDFIYYCDVGLFNVSVVLQIISARLAMTQRLNVGVEIWGTRFELTRDPLNCMCQRGVQAC